jgi:drug/metabolite transporter (DMT)-like permease
MIASTGTIRIFVLTVLAMLAFAANSVLCRLALGDQTIDAASFTTVRVLSGALMLLLLTMLRRETSRVREASHWMSAAMLFVYAVCFSFAYVSLSTGTGALILFGAVQITMIVAALWSGERPGAIQWLGLVAALAGLVYLVMPGLTAPSPVGSALMALAGFGWGVYSLRGRGGKNPLAATTGNFALAVPIVMVVSLVMVSSMEISKEGLILAVLSGAITSGLGYVIWYAALKGLTATQAATVQLTVPVLAALGGVLFLSEDVTLRLLVASVLILGGVGIAVIGHDR